MLNLMMAPAVPATGTCCHPAYHELGAHGPGCEDERG